MPTGSRKIRVLLAFNQDPMGEEGSQRVTSHERIQVVGVAHKDTEVESLVQQWSPEIVLLDADDANYSAFDLTRGMNIEYPDVSFILLSADETPAQLRRAMSTGAADYLIKPLDPEAVIQSCLKVAEIQEQRRIRRNGEKVIADRSGQLIAFISGKGGIGRTTIASNIAVIAAQEEGKKVVLVGLENGDAAVLLNVTPQVGLADLVEAAPELDAQTLEPYLSLHKSGVALLVSLGLSDYYQAQPLQNSNMQTVLSLLKTMYDYVFVDFPPLLDPEDVQILNAMDQICLVTSSWDLLVLRNSKSLLEILPPHVMDRVKIVLNRFDRNDMIQESHVVKSLDRPVICTIQNDSRIAPASINEGVPFVLRYPQATIAKDIVNLSRVLMGDSSANGKEEKKRKFLFFGS